jgi:hypothetical protein
MSHRATRRTVITGLAASALGITASGGAGADPGGTDDADPTAAADRPAVAAVAYGAFRAVRAVPGEPSTPQLVLPAGYTPLAGAAYQVASRGEFYSFVQGPPDNAGVPVTLRWPGQRVSAVVTDDRRLPFTVDPTDPERLTFRLPVHRASASAGQPTLQVWSFISRSTSGIEYRIEHNDPDRAAGYWATAPWPSGAVKAVVTYLVASEAILLDSGLAARARARGHFFNLMGFETNNLLHPDNPPHWHLAYYPGPTTGAAKATVPHYWVDRDGRTFYNGQDVQGAGRTRYHPGDPAPILDAEGDPVVTTTIRLDGGLDIEGPGGPRYSITSPDGSYTGPVRILKDGQPWRSVVAIDDVRAGVMRNDVRGYGRDPVRERMEYRYDPLTGPITSRRPY